MHRKSFREFLLIGVLIVVSIPALPQSQFPQPPQIPYGISISTQNAKAVAAVAIAEAQKNHWTMAIAIVDTRGFLVYFERLQNTSSEIELAVRDPAGNVWWLQSHIEDVDPKEMARRMSGASSFTDAMRDAQETLDRELRGRKSA